MNKIANQKLFVLLLILSLIMIFNISMVQGAELNRDNITLLSPEKLSDRNAIETVIDQYFQSRYKVRATMQTQDFTGVLADSRKADEFRQKELDRQEIEIHQAKLFGLDYVEYKYFINIKEIQFNDKEGIATVILEESHDVVFSSTQPIVSKMYNLEHVVSLTKTETGWKIVNDVYEDYLNRVLSETGMSKEEVIEVLDRSYAKYSKEINSDPSDMTFGNSVFSNASSYYNRSGAVNYAHQYAYNYNTAYYDFGGVGGDCTNFVSQAIHEGGGISEEVAYGPYGSPGSPGWYYNSSGDYAASWTDVQSLYDFITTSAYWKNEGPKGFNAGSVWGVRTGDVIQYKWHGDNYWGHSVIIVTWNSNSYPIATVASHDTDHDYYPYNYFSYGDIRFIRITGEW